MLEPREHRPSGWADGFACLVSDWCSNHVALLWGIVFLVLVPVFFAVLAAR